VLDKSQVEAKHDDGIHVLEAAKKLILAAFKFASGGAGVY
jgi:hypothetical protein